MGAWNCALKEFHPIEDVPFHLRGLWAKAMDAILWRIQADPEEAIALERGLK